VSPAVVKVENAVSYPGAHVAFVRATNAKLKAKIASGLYEKLFLASRLGFHAH
jgi:hypothetical protein